MMTLISMVVVSVILSLVASEVEHWFPWLAARLVRYEAAKLPRQSERMTEQWLADLDEIPGNVGKLLYAVLLVVRHASLVETVPTEEETPGPQIVSVETPTISISAPPAWITITATAVLNPPSVTLTGHAPSVLVQGPPLSASVQEVPRIADHRRHPAYMSTLVQPLNLPLHFASTCSSQTTPGRN